MSKIVGISFICVKTSEIQFQHRVILKLYTKNRFTKKMCLSFFQYPIHPTPIYRRRSEEYQRCRVFRVLRV